MLIQACLNGSRRRDKHPALPVTAAEIVRDAAAVMAAGAACIHVHPRRADGTESLSADDIAAVVRGVHAQCPGLAVGVSTAAWIEPDLQRRIGLIAEWNERPDFASVNLREEGSLDVIDVLTELGVEVEAGIWDEVDARTFTDQGLDTACLRVLVEVEAEAEPVDAVRLAARIDAILDVDLSETPRLHHGGGIATWRVLREAISNGHDVRIGLEDTLIMEDGSQTTGNEALIRAVRDMARAGGRAVTTA